MNILFDGDDIRSALTELTERAEAAGISATVCIVGGAAIELLLGNRGTTRDIDSIVFQVGILDDIISDIAKDRGWSTDWLNSKVSAFVSDYDDPHQWNELIRTDSVVVRIAPVEVLIAMKLRAGRGQRDFDDLELLMNSLGWGTKEARAKFESLYPHDVLNERSERFLTNFHSPHTSP